MRKLTGYGETTTYYYWLASPYADRRIGVYLVTFSDSGVGGTSDSTRGVRPVVVLSSEFFDIVEGEVEGVYEIEGL